MSEAERAAEAVIVQVAKLELKPGDWLAVMAPPDWSAGMIVQCQQYLEAINPGLQIVLLPHDSKLTVIRPPEPWQPK